MQGNWRDSHSTDTIIIAESIAVAHGDQPLVEAAYCCLDYTFLRISFLRHILHLSALLVAD
jgi:hypothetical protein